MSNKNLFPALMIWKHQSLPTDAIGMGRVYSTRQDSSGSIRLQLRMVEGDTFPWSTVESEAVRDIVINIHFDNGTYTSGGFIAHDVYYADERKVEAILKIMRKWNKKAASLYVGGTETVEQLVRRMIAATGAKTAVFPDQTPGTNKVGFMSLNLAMRDYVLPAVEQVRGLIAPRAA